MYRSVYIFVVFAILTSWMASAQSMESIRRKCLMEVGLEDNEEFQKNEENTKYFGPKCYVACMVREMGMVDADGNLEVDLETYESCAKFTGDFCERAYETLMCIEDVTEKMQKTSTKN